MLTTVVNEISKLFSSDTNQLQLGYQPRYEISSGRMQLERNIDNAEKLLKSAQKKYDKLNKQRSKRDVTTNFPIDAKVNKVYYSMIEALKGNVNNQTLSSLNVEGLSEEELKEDNYTYELYKHTIKEKNLDGVKLLVEKGANTGVRNSHNNSILHVAATFGNLDIMQYLVNEVGMDIEVKTKDDTTPLHYCDCVECTSFLISKCANVNAQNKDGLTPLHYALSYSMDVFKKLVNSSNIIVNMVDYDGFSILTRAVDKGNKEAVDLLLDKGAIVDFFDYRHSAIHTATSGNRMYHEILDSLLKHRPLRNAEFLYETVKTNANNEEDQVKAVGVILNHLSSDQYDSHYATISLFQAISDNKLHLVKLFIEKNIGFVNEGSGHYNAINVAISNNRTEAARLILESGIKVDINNHVKFGVDHAGYTFTPLGDAIMKTNKEAVVLLLEFRVDVNKRINNMISNKLPLDCALKQFNDNTNCENCSEIVKLLVSAGAKASQKWNNEELPDFLIRTDEQGVFRLAENATDYSITTPSCNITDIQVSNSSSVTVSR